MFLSLVPLVLGACADNAVGPGPDSAEPEAIPPDETPNPGKPSIAELARFAGSSNAFGFELYRKAAAPTGNVALSPFSISTALAMTWAGARGETEAQMRKVLHLDGARESVLGDVAKVSASMQASDKPYKLRAANRLFGEKTASFEQPYLDETKKAFGAPLAPLDFKGNADGARASINGWVEQQTEKRIKNLLPAGSIEADTRLVLVNAIYFLADWATPFKKESTYAAAFSTAASATKQVPTMHAQEHFRFAQQDGVKLLEMPYVGSTMSMVLVLPDAVDGIAALEQSLSADKLKTLRAAATDTKVEVALPKFEIDPAESIPLGKVLESMGMSDLFQPRKADLTGIANPPSPDQRLFVSHVFHKAFVKVDEKGTEAAAATAVVMAEAGAAAPTDKPPEFKADHPFLFFIVDKDSGLVLFMGRVADPEAK